MSEATQSDEPSMEDILASIRRIISEEDEAQSPPKRGQPIEPHPDVKPAPPAAATETQTPVAQPAAPDAGHGELETLELRPDMAQDQAGDFGRREAPPPSPEPEPSQPGAAAPDAITTPPEFAPPPMPEFTAPEPAAPLPADPLPAEPPPAEPPRTEPPTSETAAPAPPAGEDQGDEVVLDLTEMVAPDGSVVKIESDAEPPQPALSAPPATSPPPSADAETEAPTRPVPRPDDQQRRGPPQPGAPAAPPSFQDAAAPPGELPPQLQRTEAPPESDPLVLEPSAAIDPIAARPPEPAAPTPEPVAPTHQATPTPAEPASARQPAPTASIADESALEVLVRRALEPMLHEWLERNLPRLIEEIAADEVRRIAAARTQS